MGGSLRDQLLKAGLVDEKQVRKAKQSKHKQAKRQRNAPAPPVDEAALRARKAQEEKAARDRELNQRQREEAERKALAAQVRQLIEANRQPRDDGDVSYSFLHGSKVKSLWVSARQQALLGSGGLAIVTVDGRYELVPSAVVEKIRSRDPGGVVLHNEGGLPEESDDEYAKFKVPDDLMW